MAFKEDLVIGIKAQDFLIEELSEEFPGIKAIEGRFSNYDLLADNGYTIEVKFDMKSKVTDNVGIEYEYNGKPSGIAKTTAIEWIHIYYYNNQWVYSRIKTDNLKAFLRNNWEHLIKIVGGDKLLSRMVLIKTDDFADRFDFIEIKN